MYDHGWTDERVVVAKRPMSEKERAAEARRAAEKEDARLQLRERIKRQIAESAVAETRLNELYEVIQTLEARKESLAADHVAACRPIQKELSLLRENQVSRILSGDDTDSDESRRIELQNKLAELNAKLEKQIADVDSSLTPLHREKFVVAKQVDTTLRTDLMHACSAENRIRLSVARSRCDWLYGRVASVRDAMNERPHDKLLPHMLADAEKMLFDAERLSSEAVDACVSE